jgi:glycosyltransferase involved in cell wall biosynthesis
MSSVNEASGRAMKIERCRVLMVGPWPPTKGGVTTFMRNVAASQLKDKYDFIPFTTSRPGKRNVKQDNYGYAAIFRGGVKRVVQGIAITLWHLAIYPWIVAVRRPAVIQIQASDFQAFWEAALYVLMGRLLRRAVVLRIGGSFDRFYEASGPHARAAIRRTLSRPAVVLVQSQYWKQYVDRIGCTAQTVILNNFVPGALVQARTDAPGSAVRFLLCSGEVPKLKGAYVLLDAVAALARRGIVVDVTIMAVTVPLREHIVKRGMERHVKMLDFLPHDEALEAVRRADVFLQISSSEGFPNALLEAMALGCASIVTPVGAVPEVVGPEGLCAHIVPVGHAGELAECMGRLALDRAAVGRMGLAAQKRVRERFTEEVVTPVLDRAWQFALRHSGKAAKEGSSAIVAGAHSRRKPPAC